jgi:hypothetical protein
MHMALRRARAWPPFQLNRFGGESARGRRALAAFALGAALSVLGVAGLVASGAAARDPFLGAGAAWSGARDGGYGAYQATYSFVRVDPYASERRYGQYDYYGRDEERHTRSYQHFRLRASDDYDDEAPRRRKHVHRVSANSSHANSGGREPVCVRLCDGYFFPLTGASYDPTSQSAACNSLCPDAPTEVYYRSGSDRIEDSISEKGQPYTALPVSLRYRTTADNTCSCHRDVVAYAPLSDSTLQRGDAIMTPAGFLVFKGVAGAPHGAGDFSALTKAAMPAAQRGALQSLERVSVTDRHPSLKDWMVSQTATPLAKSAKTLEKHAAVEGDKIRLLVWRGAGVD